MRVVAMARPGCGGDSLTGRYWGDENARGERGLARVRGGAAGGERRFRRSTAGAAVAVGNIDLNRAQDSSRAATRAAHLPFRRRKFPADGARSLEHVNGEQANDRLLIASSGKYDVSRILSQVEGSRAIAASIAGPALPLLKAG